MARLKTLLGLSVLTSALLASGGAVAQTSCVITCPANVTLATAPGGSSVAYSYAVPTATCGGVVQTAGLPPTGAKWYVAPPRVFAPAAGASPAHGYPAAIRRAASAYRR